MKLNTLLEKRSVRDLLKFDERRGLSNGTFNYQRRDLDSLDGSPRVVNGNFDVFYNNLKTLKGGPDRVGGYFSCSHNQLTDLKGAPTFVAGNFFCAYNGLTDLVNMPKVEGMIDASNNRLTSLKDVHRHVKSCVRFDVEGNQIKSHVLGLLLIKGLIELVMDDEKLNDIISDYLPNLEGMKGLLRCQRELIEAGYEEFAQL